MSRQTNKLSSKEKMFCRYFVSGFDLAQSALKAGYKRSPEKAGLRLLEKKAVKKELDALQQQEKKRFNENIKFGYERLAYGKVSDCIKLLFSDMSAFDDLDGMDFFNISEIKKGKDGAMDIKFFNRFEALEMLERLSEKEINKTPALYKALMDGVKAVNKQND